MVENVNRFLSPTARRLIRSYGLVVVVAVAFLLMAMFVREKDKTVPVESLERTTSGLEA